MEASGSPAASTLELAAEAPAEVELTPAGDIETRPHDGRERYRNDRLAVLAEGTSLV